MDAVKRKVIACRRTGKGQAVKTRGDVFRRVRKDAKKARNIRVLYGTASGARKGMCRKDLRNSEHGNTIVTTPGDGLPTKGAFPADNPAALSILRAVLRAARTGDEIQQTYFSRELRETCLLFLFGGERRKRRFATTKRRHDVWTGSFSALGRTASGETRILGRLHSWKIRRSWV